MNKYLLLLISISLFEFGCTPKTSQEIGQSKDEKDIVVVPGHQVDLNLSPCKKFSDAINPDQIETDYVIYKDFLDEERWDKSFELWKKVYRKAPAADGLRSTVYLDGVQLYEHFIEVETDSVKINTYIEKILGLYDEIIDCYPSEKGEVLGYKAFDLYHSYPGRISDEELFLLFKSVIDTEGNKTPDFVLSAFTSMLIDRYEAKTASMEEAQKYDKILRSIIIYGLANCEGDEDCIDWGSTAEYVRSSLTYFETEKGFYDCDFYVKKYYPLFNEGEKDCNKTVLAYTRLKFGDCAEEQPQFAEIITYATANCVEEGLIGKAMKALKDSRYKEAINYFDQAAADEDYKDRQPSLFLFIAKIYYAHLHDFPKAKKYALKAAKAKSNWGEPFILIGELYASSGPLCGPGRGWDSQIVVWPAIDKWKHAKAIDPSVSKIANKWIKRYTQFMPSREDVFQRTLKQGASFYVGCWIKESTRIRSVN